MRHILKKLRQLCLHLPPGFTLPGTLRLFYQGHYAVAVSENAW